MLSTTDVKCKILIFTQAHLQKLELLKRISCDTSPPKPYFISSILIAAKLLLAKQIDSLYSLFCIINIGNFLLRLPLLNTQMQFYPLSTLAVILTEITCTFSVTCFHPCLWNCPEWCTVNILILSNSYYGTLRIENLKLILL